MRFDYERDSDVHTYVWDRADMGKLLGMIMRPMKPWCRFYPVAGGGLESWEPGTGTSVAARADSTGDAVVFTLSREDGPVMARRP